MNLLAWIAWLRKFSPQDLGERYEDLPPHGRILFLGLQNGALKPKGDAIARKLMKFVERTTPFVAIVIDLNGIRLRLIQCGPWDCCFDDGSLGKRVGGSMCNSDDGPFCEPLAEDVRNYETQRA